MRIEPILRRLQLGRSKTPPVDPEVRLATYPPPFPTGWYQLCQASEINGEKIKFVEALGEQLIVFRDATAQAAVLDAYCPHLGANLAGGRVVDGQVECPFHHWKIGGCGKVTHIPYSDAKKKSLRTRSWPVCEQHGLIFFWYEANRVGRAPIEPHYQLRTIEEVDRGDMVYRGGYDAGTVDMHLIEFSENSVDFAHFDPLHSHMVLPFLGWRIPGVRISHTADWTLDPEDDHVAYFHDDAVLDVFGRRVESTRAQAMITFNGPGSVVTFSFDIPQVGRIVMYHTHLPVEPMKQWVRFRWFAEPHVPRALILYVVGLWIAQWRADINIWENKVYSPKPMLVPGDGPVLKMRKWFRQFYESSTPSSPKVVALKS